MQTQLKIDFEQSPADRAMFVARLLATPEIKGAWRPVKLAMIRGGVIEPTGELRQPPEAKKSAFGQPVWRLT
jgi:hypothetical protein